MSSKGSNHELAELWKKKNNPDITLVKAFKEKYPRLHWTKIKHSASGETILHLVARSGDTESVKFLLQNYFPRLPDWPSDLCHKTALHEAAKAGHFDTVKMLVENGADVNKITKNEMSVAMFAILQPTPNMYAILDYLITNGALLNYKNRDGWTLLHISARIGELSIFKLLVNNNVDIHARTNNGRTALHVASLHGNLHIAKELLDLGADVNAMDKCGNTPIFEAISGMKSVQLCKFLFEHSNCNESTVNNVGYNLLHLASFGGDVSMVNYVLSELKFNPNLSTPTGITPLHCAGRRKHLEAYQLLLDFGADESLQDNFHRTSKDYMNM